MQTDSDPDVVLLERWRAGDNDAGVRLHDRHADAVIRFFRNKVRHAAEDLVHETFVRLWARRDQIRDGNRFRAYLVGIARNVLYEHVRQLVRDRAIDPEVDAMDSLAPGPSTIAARRREQRLLLEGLRRLPIEQQVILELFYWEGMKANELAAIFDVSHSAMRSRLAKARALLRDIIAEFEESRALIASTTEGLDEWAAQLRAQLDVGGSKGPES